MRTVSDLARLWDDALTQVSPDYWKWPNHDTPAAYLSRVAASDAIGAGLLVAHYGALRSAYAPGIAEYLSRVIALGGVLGTVGMRYGGARVRVARDRTAQVAAVISEWRAMDADTDAEAAIDARAGLGTGADLWWSRLLDQHARPLWVTACAPVPREAAILSAATALCWLSDLYRAGRVARHPVSGVYLTVHELAAYKRDRHHQTAN
ncbi:hypothetical protein [Actinomyces succiniciruminis]|uniref:Uncharacterized protein n=1 Tax=Actinomyces succiniciruminis TaxID=1522002 RepID=A0A1L7RLH2_9ACTO|nr:hypothetical protein [Actinomyces succiniciruminis]CED90278.1 Hypothetical protein AAM4_0383 [Actinomyces succiniciruminis]